MEDEQRQNKIIRAELENGTIIDIQTNEVRGEEDVASMIFSFKDVTDKIESISSSVIETLKKVKPQSASVEFGLQIAAESGQLTALLVKGTSTANLKITLHWGENTLNDTVY